jgi:hypothetical protein
MSRVGDVPQDHRAAVAGERPGYAHVYLVAVSLWLAAHGYLPQATRLAAVAVADAARMRGSDGKFHHNATIRELDKRAGQLKAQAITTAGNAREKILDIARHAATDGADPVQTAAGRRRDARREAAGEIAAQPPWPALVDRRLLWWPAAEYDRLVRQVPDIAGDPGRPVA